MRKLSDDGKRMAGKNNAAMAALIGAIALLCASFAMLGSEAMAQRKPKVDKPTTSQTNSNGGMSNTPQSKQAEPDKKPVVQDVVVDKQKTVNKKAKEVDGFVRQ